MPIYCQKNVKHAFHMHILCQKMPILSKTQCSHVTFFLISNEKHLCHVHIWLKTINSVKPTLYYGQKKSIGCPFFRFLCLYFINKRPFSKKHTALMPIFCQYSALSLKNTILSCHFFEIFKENPLLSRPYLVKKRQFCQNYPTL